MSDQLRVFDFDNHYYEASDALTRHLDPKLGSRGVRWAEINGRRKLVIGGSVNNYIANPSFNPVARPGALFDWYRGNPKRQGIVEAFGELEPLPSYYQDRESRLALMDEQGLDAMLLFPTLGVGVEEALKNDPEACYKVFRAFNQWVDEDWGYRFEDRMFAVPYIPMLSPRAAVEELEAVLARNPAVVNVRNAPVPVPGGYTSPFSEAYDPFWSLVEDSGVVVATHAGLDGYDMLVQMWEDSGPETSLFRSPLRGVVTKARAVADFYAAAVCQLIFERHPGLKMASVENGAGWIPDLLHRLDDAANRNPGYFRDHPREVFGEHVWATPFWEDHVEDFGTDVRVDRLLMGSDWPHAEGTVAPRDFMTETLKSLDEADMKRVVWDNPVELLGVTPG
jgi:predicted TIM-barrel fold metal-dependent hydrolase